MRKILILVSLALFTMQCESPPPTPVVDVEYLYDWMERVDRSLRLQPSEPVTHWEYMSGWGRMDGESMNFYGKNGWELVSYSMSVDLQNTSQLFYVFKRPLQ